MPKTDGITSRSKEPYAIINEGNTSLNESKCSSDPRKMPAEMYFNEKTEIERHKLAIPKPWFAPAIFDGISSSISKDIPVSDSLVFEEFCPVSSQTIPHTTTIYEKYHNTETNQPMQVSSTTDFSRESRLHPRIFVDKISKWSIFKK